ncbi:uncharacterized protein BcabD6B2_18790 [Babesia caballi]|uniref:Uncharacterized protein n=1 Tax=Babesia caballi TaxID=5871 RepID=A0AAV4LUZ7_BABCB|nr:hypothetical protein, conserved [Babesia caballi]
MPAVPADLGGHSHPRPNASRRCAGGEPGMPPLGLASLDVTRGNRPSLPVLTQHLLAHAHHMLRPNVHLLPEEDVVLEGVGQVRAPLQGQLLGEHEARRLERAHERVHEVREQRVLHHHVPVVPVAEVVAPRVGSRDDALVVRHVDLHVHGPERLAVGRLEDLPAQAAEQRVVEERDGGPVAAAEVRLQHRQRADDLLRPLDAARSRSVHHDIHCELRVPLFGGHNRAH